MKAGNQQDTDHKYAGRLHLFLVVRKSRLKGVKHERLDSAARRTREVKLYARKVILSGPLQKCINAHAGKR